MSDYRRWISYIYSYENGVKKDSAGYARLELNNGKIRMTIFLNPGKRSGSAKVCCYKSRPEPPTGVFLGDFNLSAAAPVFRKECDASDVEGSGLFFQELNGLILFGDDGSCLASSWEDEPLAPWEAEEIRKQLQSAGDGRKKEPASGSSERMETMAGSSSEQGTAPRGGTTTGAGSGQSAEAEVAGRDGTREENADFDGNGVRTAHAGEQRTEIASGNGQSAELAGRDGTRTENAGSDGNGVRTAHAGEQRTEIASGNGQSAELAGRDGTRTENAGSDGNGVRTAHAGERRTEIITGSGANPDNMSRNGYGLQAAAARSEAERASRMENSPGAESMDGQRMKTVFGSIQRAEMASGGVGDAGQQKAITVSSEPTVKRLTPEAAAAAEGCRNAWRTENREERVFRCLTPMYPFDDGEFERGVRMEPQDIGMLPRMLWKLAGNSFLLHSFYTYQHLLFTRKRQKGGNVCYLMLPGVYNEREQHMAQMFGFSRFRPVKRQQLENGVFGYWYMEVKFEHQKAENFL